MVQLPCPLWKPVCQNGRNINHSYHPLIESIHVLWEGFYPALPTDPPLIFHFCPASYDLVTWPRCRPFLIKNEGFLSRAWMRKQKVSWTNWSSLGYSFLFQKWRLGPKWRSLGDRDTIFACRQSQLDRIRNPARSSRLPLLKYFDSRYKLVPAGFCAPTQP